jgi:GNAT superfamily N-acetyltransferase
VSGSVVARGPDAGRRAHLVAATAANLATWHDANVRALGFRTEWRDGWWMTPDDVPVIFFRAIAVRPGADPDVPARDCHQAPNLAACDPWSDLGLERHGMTFEADRPWMTRPAGAPPAPPVPDGVTVDRVVTPEALAEYERTAALGFGSSVQPPHTWHAPGILADPRFDHWLARSAGDAVATGNGLREAGVLGVYSISTLPAARRRGLGAAITARTVAAAPDLPAVLQPSEMAEPIYRRLGFERFTTFRTWTRRSR